MFICMHQSYKKFTINHFFLRFPVDNSLNFKVSNNALFRYIECLLKIKVLTLYAPNYELKNLFSLNFLLFRYKSKLEKL